MRYFPLHRVSRLAGGALLLAAASCSSKSETPPKTDAGGSDTVTINPLCYMAADDVISDFRLDNGVMLINGRQGGWYTYADLSGAGTLVPMEGTGGLPDHNTGNPNCSGVGSWHVSATNFTDWGAATAVDWMPKVPDDTGMNVKGAYDASRYRGVSFWAKAATPVKFVQVKFNDPWTDVPSVLPLEQRCVFNTNMPDKNCSPYIVKFGYGWEVTGEDGGAQDATVAATWPAYADYKIDTDWKRFVVYFEDTRQDSHNPGQQSPGNKLDVTKLMGMGIQVNTDHSTTPPTANNFEIWIDDVAFIK